MKEEDPKSALIALYPRLRRAMSIFLRGSRIDADDVVQDAYIKAFEHLDTFRDESAMYTWIYQIARNRALDLMRKKTPELLPDGSMMDQLRSRDTDSTSEQVLALRHAIHQLPPSLREVVILKVQEGFSYEEMAQITGVQIQTLKSRMFRAKKQLYQLLSSH